MESKPQNMTSARVQKPIKASVRGGFGAVWGGWGGGCSSRGGHQVSETDSSTDLTSPPVCFLFSLLSLSSVTRKCFYQPLKWFLGGGASVEQKKGTVKQKASPARQTITNLIRLLNTSKESRIGAFIPVSPLHSHTDIVCSLSAPAGPCVNDTNL